MKTCPTCGLVFPDESNFCFLSGDSLQPTPDPMVGTTLAGRFRIEAVISESAWSKMYAARHRLLSRKVVVKVFKAQLGDELRARFSEAVQKARRCTHTNVAELVAGGISPEGLAYLVQPATDAQPLSALLSKGALPPARALGIAAQLFRALCRIHDFGAVHGNLRPSNVLLSNGDHVDVVDVGLGRSLLRDPWDSDPESLRAQRYFAPELSSNQRQSQTADIYAAGVITYQLLTGGVPFDAATVGDLRDKINDDATLNIDTQMDAVAEPVRKWLSGVISRAESKRLNNAHQAYDELMDACNEGNMTMVHDPGRPPAEAKQELDAGIERWRKFGALFSKMVEIGFPGGAPAQTADALAAIHGRVEKLSELAKRGAYEHDNMAAILERAREGRKGIADQMDALNDEAKGVRKELHPLRVAAERHGDKARAFPSEALQQHREVVLWEGRSAFAEPYKELADAYRAMADLMDKWWGVRNAQLTCERDAAEKRELIVGVDSQLEELRGALRVHESNLAAEIDATEVQLSELGNEADKTEFELLDLASRFSAPLRSKPELGACFRELAQS